MRINKDRMIDKFQKLVSIDNPSYNEKQMCEYLKQELINLGFDVEEDNVGEIINGNCGNLYAYKKGEISGEPLLFSSHMDTVEPAKGKVAVVKENGVITSKGDTVLGADDCAGIVAILEALQTIKDNNIPHHSIEVLFTVAEEVYCKGAENFDYSKIKSNQAFVLDLTGEIGTAAYKAPTILSFSIVINGKAAHAGFAPEDGIHTIAVACDAINKLKLGRIDDDTTVNIGIINSGVATNIIPDRCEIKGEVRSYNHSEAVRQIELIKEIFESSAIKFNANINFESYLSGKAYEIPLDHEIVKRFTKACEKQEQKTEPKLIKTFGGSDANVFVKNSIPGLVIATAMNNCHSCDEFTTVDELCRIAELTITLMTE